MATRLDQITNDPALQTTARGTVTLLPDPEPAPLFCPIISTDDHVLEPATLFEERVPAALAAEMPRIEDDDEGVPYWVVDDARLPIMVSNGAAGRPIEEWTLAPQRFDEFRSGVTNVDQRVRDMDLNGIYASLVFPSIPWGFAGKTLSAMKNREAGLWAVRAYNQWLLEEWCGAHPTRFIPCQLPWLPDPVIAADEIRANAEKGFKAVSFSENPEGLDYPNIYTDHWDPFFQACVDTDTVVNLHVGSSGSIVRPSSVSPKDVMVALFPLNGVMTLIDWIYSGIPLRFPTLKIALSEGGVSWVPMAYERLERAYRQREATKDWTSDLHPVDVARRNFWYTSIEDPTAFQNLELVGADRVTLESDYPHPDTTWPETQTVVRDQLAHLPVDRIKKVAYANAAELYRHPLPPADLVASSEVGSGSVIDSAGQPQRYSWWRS